jgi:hypothetical protein
MRRGGVGSNCMHWGAVKHCFSGWRDHVFAHLVGAVLHIACQYSILDTREAIGLLK